MTVLRTKMFFLLILLSLLMIIPCYGQQTFRSLDGRYEAILTGSGSHQHYKVIETKTGKQVMLTHSQYPKTPNDVKAAVFSPDSKQIAAAYHYGHKGGYTWIGIWDINSGMLLDSKELPGYTTDVSSVFKKN